MAKNTNGQGSIYKRAKDGKDAGYAGAVSYVDPETGKSRRHTVYGQKHADVKAKLDAARKRLDAGAPVKDAKRTVADWLAHWRATTLAASDRKESTKALYGTLSRNHLEREPFGTITLDKLKPSDVEGLVLSLRTKVRPDGSRALADSTIRQTYTILRAGLDGAVRDQLIARNPAAAIRRPGVARTEAVHVDAGDVTKLLAAAQGSRYHSALVLIAATGMRRGEALALRWEHVDLEAGVLHVRGTLSRVNGRLLVTEPKTARSRRTVPVSPAVVALLRRHRTAQLQERLRAGNQWTDCGHVITTEAGSAVDPRNLLRTITLAAKAAQIEHVGVHTLRHSAAVAWLEAGVHIKAVSDLLGHSSIAITGDVYGHTSDDTARSAVDGLSSVLGL